MFDRILTGLAVVAVILLVASFAKAAPFIKLENVGVSMDIKTKAAVGDVNFTVANAVSLNVATDETATVGLNLTDILKIGHESVRVYVERQHDLRGDLIRDASNVVGVTVSF